MLHAGADQLLIRMNLLGEQSRQGFRCGGIRVGFVSAGGGCESAGPVVRKHRSSEVVGIADINIENVGKERLKDAPGFDKDHWPNMADQSSVKAIHAYYGTQP